MIENLDLLVTSRCGSSLFNLHDPNTSDNDYFALVNSPNINEISTKVMSYTKYNDDDLFYSPITAMYDIRSCASCLIVPSYDAIVSYTSEPLYNFHKSNAIELAEIHPGATYHSALNTIKMYIDTNRVGRFNICIRLIALLWTRYYLDSFLTARDNIPEFWRERYFRAKEGNMSISEVKKYLDEIKTLTIVKFYTNQPINYALHDEYKSIIDKILEGDDI